MDNMIKDWQIKIRVILVFVVGIIFIISGFATILSVATKIYIPTYVDEMNAYYEMRFYFDILTNLILGVAGCLAVLFGFAVVVSSYYDFASLIEKKKRYLYASDHFNLLNKKGKLSYEEKVKDIDKPLIKF